MHFSAIWSCNFTDHEYMISNISVKTLGLYLKSYAERFQGKLHDILVNSELSEFGRAESLFNKTANNYFESKIM